MSEQHEPSYYEIALTGRQVLVAFVVLLVCVLAAFFSGVWVGRDGTPTGSVRAADALASNSGPGANQDGIPEASEPEFEELSFFDPEGQDGGTTDRGSDPSAAAAQQDAKPVEPRPTERPPSRDTTLAQDVGAVPPAAARLGDNPRLPTSRPAATKPESTPTKPAPTKPAPKPATTAPAASSTPSAALPGSGDLVIQVLVTGERSRAEEAVGQLKGKGFRAFLSPVQRDGKTLYRVRVGPFEERARAETAAGRIQRELGLETWITR